ncbi:efflux RND transporter periplasmic adaptor subunit [Candidatus Ichthyocystis sparus]|uniref:efflux RND transporter periplasmic adaptor subunit n=1 Tax=Candidatus Ichthyocystis sparus TaxID=1561004 RepID=UPI001F5F480B|nr:efflux RND transporter periplasmic adaptor subunit [Candidatus Ichthyocystis sparus]
MLVACGQQSHTEREVTPLVSVVQLEIADSMTRYRTYFGRVVPRQNSILSFQVPGHIQKRHASMGQVVSKGDLLFELDDHDYQAATQAANYLYQATSAQFEAASVDYDNSKKLLSDRFITEPDLNRRHAKLLLSQGEMFKAKAKLVDAQNRLSDTRLLAPYDGTITQIMAEDGQNVAPGIPVAVIARDDSFDITIDIPQSDIGLIKNTSNAKITIDYAPNNKRSCSGQIKHIGSNTDPRSNTYPVIIALEKCDAKIRLGMTGYVNFSNKLDKNNYFLVPVTAVSSREKGPTFIFTVEKNKLHEYNVSIIGSDDNDHYVIESAELPPDSNIVIGPIFMLHNNQNVRVTREMSNEKLRQSKEVGHLS